VIPIARSAGSRHIPAARAISQIGALSAADCLLTLLVALGSVTPIELWKLARRSMTPGVERRMGSAR
jgi:hypothetical protein